MRLADGSWVVNLHASTHVETRARRDTLRALESALEWTCGRAAAVRRRREPVRPAGAAGAACDVGGNHVDHLYTEGRPARAVEVLERGRLSDHPPVRVSL